jgi:hypothetical protein
MVAVLGDIGYAVGGGTGTGIELELDLELWAKLDGHIEWGVE